MSLSLSLYMCIHIYEDILVTKGVGRAAAPLKKVCMYVYVCICICIDMYTYIYI